MPASQKRKEGRAKPARDDRRLAILHYPASFGTKVDLDAHVDLLRSLTNDVMDYEDLHYYKETILVFTAALEVFLNHLCSAAKHKRILDHTTATGDKDKALTYMKEQLQISIDYAHHVAGQVYIYGATYRVHVTRETTSLDKVPKDMPMLEFFGDTGRAYDGLKKALAKHTIICYSMGTAYAAGTLDAKQTYELSMALNEVWWCRANQLVHTTVKEQFEEFALRFFEDTDAYKEAIKVLDAYEEGFKGPWEYVIISEEMMRPGREKSAGEGKETGNEADAPEREDAEDV